ncbi:MAG: penicillin-binding protein 2, partial [Thermodesulfovibrionales bacterium]|nr:penicillin-binding protein 2 [Thermodesulfovibrionales bacterium]
MTRRAVILNTVIIGAFAVIMLRLFDLMIINHGRLKIRAEVQHYKKEKKEVVRGLILDRRGRELAVNIDAESVFLRPHEIESPEKCTMVLSRFLDKRPDLIRAKLTSQQRFLWIERGVDPEKTEKLKKLNLKGIGFIREPKRYYPKKELASHVIGFVNIDQKGLEGIELMYDSQLRSILTRASLLRDANGRYLSEGLEEPKGNNIVLTIDEGLQYISEKSLEKALSAWKAKWGVIIMMDPFTGEIFSMAVRPSYDPNNFSKYEPAARRNRAITDSYEPGSTFKLVTAAAALEEGILTPDTKIDCQGGKIRIGSKVIEDVHPAGFLTFKEVLEKSSNVGIIKIAQKIGAEKLYHYARLFGFGSKTGIDIPGEASGSLRPPDKWSVQSMGAIPIGYEVATTPLQILRAYAAVANGGWLVRPHI